MKKSHCFAAVSLVALSSACADDDQAAHTSALADAAIVDTAAGSGDAFEMTSTDVTMEQPETGPDANSVQPPSLIVLTHDFGFLDESFRLPGVADGTEVLLSSVGEPWSPILRPFSRLREHLVAVAGGGYHVSWEQDVYQPTMLLTGYTASASPKVRPGQPPQALGPSVDWLVGHRLRPMASAAATIVIGWPSHTFDEAGKNVRHVNSLAAAATAIKAETDCNIELKPPTPSATGLTGWMEQVIPVVTTALPCDGARVFSLNLPQPSPQEVSFVGGLAQDAAHRIGIPGEEGRGAREVMERYNVVVATQVARLAQSLATSKGRDGAPLLDNTLLVWVGREGQPNHNAFPWHAILIGGSKLGLVTGRYISLPKTTDFVLWTGEAIKTGPPHNKFLTSIARLFGVAVDSVGAKSMPLKTGGSLDLTGHLPVLDGH